MSAEVAAGVAGMGAEAGAASVDLSPDGSVTEASLGFLTSSSACRCAVVARADKQSVTQQLETT